MYSTIPCPNWTVCYGNSPFLKSVNHLSMVQFPWDPHPVATWLPSGKHTKNYGKIHHFSWENIHYFDWAIFHSCLYVYQRVQPGFPRLPQIPPRRCQAPWSPMGRWWKSWRMGRHPWDHPGWGGQRPAPVMAIPSGKLSHSYRKSQFFMGKSTISTGPFSIAMFV